MNGSRRRVAGVRRLGDAVVEQAPAGPQPARQEPEVPRQRRAPEVLGQPDRADGVELRGGRVAVVQMADLGEVAQAAALDLGLRPLRLVARQRHAQRPHPVLGRGVHDHRAPAAAHVEQPHPRLQPELLRHQLELGRLRLLQRGVRRRVDRAGVGHRRAEHPLVEGVRHVVVVRDDLAVALLRVQPARRAVLQVRWGRPGGAARSARACGPAAAAPRGAARAA